MLDPLIFDPFPQCTEHSWYAAHDGLMSCEWCGQIFPGSAIPLDEPKCDCGSEKTYGTKPYEVGHSSWCRVAPI